MSTIVQADLRRRLRRVMVEFNQMQTFAEDPLVIVEGQGIRVRDTSGKWLIDGISGVFVVSVGHGNREIIDAIMRQHDRVAFALPIMAINEPALDLAEKLCELSKGRAGAIKQYCAGSESTETAMKLARQYHYQRGQAKRFKIVSFYRGFHGTTFGALAATGQPVLQTPFQPLPVGIVHVHPPIARDWPGAPDVAACAEQCLATIRATVAGEGSETIAAIMLEPFMLTAGGHELPLGFLSGIRELCDEIGALLIIDEIVTGIGRLGAWFASDLHNVWPDLMALGKGLAGGYAPLSVVLMTESLADSFWGDPSENRQFQSGHTFASNPISAAAGLAVIDYIERNGLIGYVRTAGLKLGKQLREVARRHPVVRDVRGRGFLWALDFAAGEASGERPPTIPLGTALQQRARTRGLLIRASHRTVQLAPPLVTTDSEITEIVSILDDALDELDRDLESGALDELAPAFSL
jgi:adenosylmethionine-8-amino-7-oxononanoate aminotransferase